MNKIRQKFDNLFIIYASIFEQIFAQPFLNYSGRKVQIWPNFILRNLGANRTNFCSNWTVFLEMGITKNKRKISSSDSKKILSDQDFKSLVILRQAIQTNKIITLKCLLLNEKLFDFPQIWTQNFWCSCI